MGIRVSGRLCPDVVQAGIAAATVVQQSRVTFSGQRGTVICEWNVRVVNAGAVAIPSILMTQAGTAQSVAHGNGAAWFEATAALNFKLHATAVFVDPPPGSFVEMLVTPNAGSFDIPADAGQVKVITHPLEVGEGPTATIG